MDTFKKLSALQSFLKYYCLRRGIKYEEPVPVSTWRYKGIQHIINLSSANKITLQKHLKKILNNEKVTTDMADSIGLGLWFGTNIGYKELLLDQAEMVVITDTSNKNKTR